MDGVAAPSYGLERALLMDLGDVELPSSPVTDLAGFDLADRLQLGMADGGRAAFQ